MGEHLDAEALYRAHADFVGRFLLRLGAKPDDVPDLIQDVFLVAHRRGGFTVDRAKPTTWLAAIAFRVHADRRKKRRRRREDSDAVSVSLAPSEQTTPSQRAEARQALARVGRALEVLSPAKRAVFVLYELEGHSCAEIGEALGVPTGTIYSRLHAARREFTTAHDVLEDDPAAGIQKPSTAEATA